MEKKKQSIIAYYDEKSDSVKYLSLEDAIEKDIKMYRILLKDLLSNPHFCGTFSTLRTWQVLKNKRIQVRLMVEELKEEGGNGIPPKPKGSGILPKDT